MQRSARRLSGRVGAVAVSAALFAGLAGVPVASASPVLLVTAGSICNTAGETGIGSSGATYTCKDDGAGKLRWL